MDYLVNDLSVNGQFPGVDEFCVALDSVMSIRHEINRLGSVLYCHRSLSHAQVTAQAVMQQAVQMLSIEKRRSVMQWLTRNGPYWEDARIHSGDSWLEANGEIVTDTAIGETAVCRTQGMMRELISLAPSAWLSNPVNVDWQHDDGNVESIDVPNHWELASVQQSLAASPATINSWDELRQFVENACEAITFANDTFEPLSGQPFVPGASLRIQVLLQTLDKLKRSFDGSGERTTEGHKLYADYFTGKKAWFTDSSATEKAVFKNELTFRHPEHADQHLFCPWHGKVKTPQIRIHFSWPIENASPLYVVFIGPKLTKR